MKPDILGLTREDWKLFVRALLFVWHEGANEFTFQEACELRKFGESIERELSND